MMENELRRIAATRKELARIIASEPFTRSARMRDFLVYVVEETLQGRGDRIKAFSIAQDVFGKDESFDPQRDTIIRVEAGRLRRRLAAWYAGPGRESTIRIDIPVGGYVPSITEVESIKAPGNRFALPALLPAILAVVLVAVLAWLALRDSAELSKVQTADVSPIPFVAVLPLNLSGEQSGETQLAEGFVESLITSLAKLSGISVMAHSSILGFDSSEADIDNLRNNYGVSHVLRGNLGVRNGAVSMNLQLVSTGTSAILWADTLKGSTEDIWKLQETLAQQVTQSLAVTVLPNEQEMYLRRHSDNFEALAYYRQGWVLLIPPNNIDRILTARNLFNRAAELDPDFAGGFAGAGFSHAITVLFINTDNPGRELQLAAELAQKAIDIDPGFGMGYAALSFTRALQRSLDEGLENAQLAIELSPGDAFVQFIYGMNLVISGYPAEAIRPLEQAIRLDPTEVRTPYVNVLAIAHYAIADYATCIKLLDQNRDRGGPTGPHMDAFRAAALLGLGQDHQAAALISDIRENHPSFPTADWLRKWLAESGQLEVTLKRMQQAGLPPA